MKEIYSLIRKFNVNSKYKGYHYLAYAVELGYETPEEKVRVTKVIYPMAACKFKVNPENIEHGIRTMAELCWKNNPKYMEKLAGHQLDNRPSNAQFINMLVYELKKTS